MFQDFSQEENPKKLGNFLQTEELDMLIIRDRSDFRKTEVTFVQYILNLWRVP